MAAADTSDPVDRTQVRHIIVSRLQIAMDFQNVRTRDEWRKMMEEILVAIKELPNVWSTNIIIG